MIIQAILSVFATAVTFLFDLLPSLPPLPGVITDGLASLTGAVTSVIGLVSYLYTPTLTVFVIVAVLALLNFDNVHKLVLWFLHKVRG